MGDLNFFEDYIEERKFKVDQKLIYMLVFGVFSLFLIGYITYSSLAIKKEKEIVSSLKLAVENPETIRRVGEIEEKEIKVHELEESLDKIKTLDTSIAERKKIDDILLEQINENIPNKIFLTSISVQQEEIYIEGISEDKWSVPEFQKNIETLDDCDETFVPYITLEEGHYNFALNITLRGVDEDAGTN